MLLYLLFLKLNCVLFPDSFYFGWARSQGDSSDVGLDSALLCGHQVIPMARNKQVLSHLWVSSFLCHLFFLSSQLSGCISPPHDSKVSLSFEGTSFLEYHLKLCSSGSQTEAQGDGLGHSIQRTRLRGRC